MSAQLSEEEKAALKREKARERKAKSRAAQKSDDPELYKAKENEARAKSRANQRAANPDVVKENDKKFQAKSRAKQREHDEILFKSKNNQYQAKYLQAKREEDYPKNKSNQNQRQAKCRILYRFKFQEFVEFEYDLEGSDLSSLQPELFKKIGRATIVNLKNCQLSTLQLNTMFSSILDGENELRELDLSSNDLCEVPAELLSQAIIRLKVCYLENCNLTSFQLKAIVHVIETEEEMKCRMLDLSENDMSEVPKDKLAGAIVRLEEVFLYSAFLSPTQLENLFIKIQNTKSEDLILEGLNVCGSPLSEVTSITLATAAIKLKELYLGWDCTLTSEQLECIFKEVIRKGENQTEKSPLKLTQIDLSWNDLTAVPSDLVVKAISKLKRALFFSAKLSTDQLHGIFSLVAEKRCDGLKNIDLSRIKSSGVSPSLRQQAKMNQDVEIKYDEDFDD